MSYQMTHMKVANDLLKHYKEIENPKEFLLGSVAPDSVHMASDYDIGRKIQSHLFEKCGEWSNTQDHVQWKNNIIQFWENHKNKVSQKEKDFLAGVCVHCFTDYCNDLNNWIEMKKKYEEIMGQEEFIKIYRTEVFQMDQWLYQSEKDAEKIIEQMAQGEPFTMDGLLKKEEIRKQQKHLLEVQFQSSPINLSNFEIFSKEYYLKFIADTEKEMMKLFVL